MRNFENKWNGKKPRRTASMEPAGNWFPLLWASPSMGKALKRTFLDFLSQSMIPVDGAMELLRYLGQKYRVFIACNGPYDQQIQRMRLAGMGQYIGGYFVSEQLGHAKPSREVFDLCYHEVQIEAKEQIIMIGDSLPADIVGTQLKDRKAIYAMFCSCHRFRRRVKRRQIIPPQGNTRPACRSVCCFLLISSGTR